MKKTYSINQRIKVYKRYREIIQVLVKYGFGEILGRMNIAARLRIGKRQLFAKTSDLARKSYAERIRLAIEELGPTFIKLGQVLSTRPFLIPVELVIELTKLQDEVPPFEFDRVKKILENEFGRPHTEIFKSLNEKCEASASLSQVHAGVLKDGRKVAVKVQRPDVRKIMQVDMEILRDLAQLLERYVPESKRFDPSGQVRELSKVSRRETDFLYEARNMQIFKINFKESEQIIIPEVYWEFTTARVLVCEFVEGIKISHVDRLKKAGIDLPAVARSGMHAIMQMIFEDRFFHGDPHPGNIFVNDKGQLILLDFGMVGQLSESMVDFLTSLLYAASTWDPRRIIRVALDYDMVPEGFDQLTIESDLTEMLYRYHKIPLWQINMTALLEDFMDVFYRHKIRLPSTFMLLTKAMMTAEEVARALDPNINMIEEIEPYVRDMARRKYTFSKIKEEMTHTGIDFYEFIKALPFDMRRIISKMRRGEIGLQFHHRGLEDLTNELYESSKRVSLSLIIAAILVSASLLSTAQLGVKILGMPILSIVGYLLGGSLTAWVILNILKSTKNR